MVSGVSIATRPRSDCTGSANAERTNRTLNASLKAEAHKRRMVPLKYKFASIIMITALIITTLPALAQASAEQQELLQGIAMIRVVVEWVVLVGLVVTMFTSSWIIVNRIPGRWSDRFKPLTAPIILGLLATGTALILEKWSLLLIIDALGACILTLTYLYYSLTFPGIRQ